MLLGRSLSNQPKTLVPRGTRHVACDKGSMCCTWFAHDCALATWACVLETVRGAAEGLQKSQRGDCENLEQLFQCVIIIIVNQPYHTSWKQCLFVDWLAGRLTSQQKGRICSDNLTCCHTEIEVADQTFYLTQSQYTDTGPTSPSDDSITPGAWQGSHWSANFEVTGMTRPWKIPTAQAGIEPGIFRSPGPVCTTR